MQLQKAENKDDKSGGRPPPDRDIFGTARFQSESHLMAWFFLILAGLLEIVWAFGMKWSDGFSRPIPSILTIIAMLASFALLALAMKSLPLGTAYAVWTGIGAVGTFIIGVVILNEPLSIMRVSAALMIAGGLLLMKLSSP